MGQLFFKKDFQTAIRRGEKSATLRRWRRPRVRAGERAYSLGLGWLRIISVEPILLGDLTDHDAHRDGFASLDLLQAALRELYPSNLDDGCQWWQVRFEPEQLTPEPPSKSSVGRRAAAHPPGPRPREVL